ncbi:MAG: hypothetical protein K6A63_01935 [Acholeplasmatales bacterium]|nr:hypothetical protein [Acholeplasmatales bacterium]
MNKNSLKTLFSILQFVVALLIVIFINAPALTWASGDQTASAREMFTGYYFAFGGSSRTVRVTEFSFLNLIPYILLGLALVADFVKYAIREIAIKETSERIPTDKAIKIYKIMSISIFATYVVIALMIFFGVFLVNEVDNLKDASSTIYRLHQSRVIAWGAIVQGCVAVFCAAIGAADAFIPFELEYVDEDEEDIEDVKDDVVDLKAELAKQAELYNRANQENNENK